MMNDVVARREIVEGVLGRPRSGPRSPVGTAAARYIRLGQDGKLCRREYGTSFERGDDYARCTGRELVDNREVDTVVGQQHPDS